MAETKFTAHILVMCQPQAEPSRARPSPAQAGMTPAFAYTYNVAEKLAGSNNFSGVNKQKRLWILSNVKLTKSE
jgi:hypothetical protein